MRTLLVVANRTIGGPDLASALVERAGDDGCRIRLLVPLPPSPPSAIAVGLAAVESAAMTVVDLPDQRDVAHDRLQCGLRWLRGLGFDADGEVVSVDPVDDIVAVAHRDGASEIIVSTLPSRVSRWLRQDLPHRIERRVSIPVAVVTAGS